MGVQRSVKSNVDELRLHVGSDGRIWHSDGTHVTASDLKPEEFATTKLVKQARKILFLGTHANASLIRNVYMTRKSDIPSSQVMIASPRVGMHRGFEDPKVIFSRMTTNTWPSSVGGWRVVTHHDFTIYSMIAEVAKSKGGISDSALVFLKQHPAWPAISFVFKGQIDPACRLLAEIVDPRWHVDVDAPEKFAQLRNYLGFGSTIEIAKNKIAAAVLLLRGYDGVCPPCNQLRVYRTMLTTAAWFGGFVTDPKLTRNLDRYLQEPSAFLLRYLYEPHEKSELYGVRFVRASHRFIRFLKMVWLDNLYLPRRYRQVKATLGRRAPSRVSRPKMLYPKGYERTLFVPEIFFDKPDEVDAWKAHTAKLRRSRK